jgi:hypothetical protein
MSQSDLHVAIGETNAANAMLAVPSLDDAVDSLAPHEQGCEFQDSKPLGGSPGVAYRQHLIVPIAGPAPEHTASYLLFEYHPNDARTRLGLFNVQSEHASVEQAHGAALKAGIEKVDTLLGPR